MPQSPCVLWGQREYFPPPEHKLIPQTVLPGVILVAHVVAHRHTSVNIRSDVCLGQVVQHTYPLYDVQPAALLLHVNLNVIIGL